MNIQKKSWLLLISIFFIFISFTCHAQSDVIIDGDDNATLPAFDAPGLFQSDRHLTSQTLQGQVYLLNVWASWCPACQKEHRVLMTIKNRYHVPIYGLNYKDSAEDAQNFLIHSGNPYVLNGQDLNGDIGKQLGVYGTPMTYLVDANGVIRYTYAGAISQEEWEQRLWPLFQSYQRESSRRGG